MILNVEKAPSRVANLLKQVVNSWCEDDFVWFDSVGEMPSVFDVLEAIKILDAADTKKIIVVDDTTESEELP